MLTYVLQPDASAPYIGTWFDGGGVTQSYDPAKTSAGADTKGAASIADGLVSAAAKLAIAVIVGSSFAARKLAPPPIE